MSETQGLLCEQCGGLLRIEYTIGFEQGVPRDMRHSGPADTRLCLGHPVASNTRDWEKLSHAQKDDLDLARQDARDCLIAVTERFYKMHPELRLYWQFTMDALFREEVNG